MRSLRTRLILSHALPLLIVLTVVGVALTYLLETQVLLAQLSNELELQAALVADAAAQNPLIWYDPVQAAAFVSRVGGRLSAHLMLLEPEGRLWATNDPAYAERLGETLKVPGLQQAVQSRSAVRVDYEEGPGGREADVLMPVLGRNWQVVGVIRLTDPLSSVYARFPRTRALIIAVLVGGLAVGVVVGWILAIDLARPLRRATDAISQMASGEPLIEVPEQGPREVRLLLRAFNALTEQLRALEKSRRRLLANLVHELGRPLGALLSATQALAGGAARDPALSHDLLDGMTGQIQRMRRLLDDLTRLYSQTLGALELHRERTPLAPWLAQGLGPWREAAQEKGLDWHTALPENLPALAIDRDRLAQALGNVVSNAIKYTPPGGAVTVSAGAEEDAVWIRVQDTGHGIPPEELERIFEPFYRGQADRRFPQGMGLGLSIARDLVAAHGGRIEVESDPGEGSTFILWLPKSENLNPSATHP